MSQQLSPQVQDLKAKSRNREEVHGPGHFEVISQEGQPALGLVRSSPSLDHILPDGVWAGWIALAVYMVPAQTYRPDKYQKPRGFALQFNLSDPVEAERIFKALAENGMVQMPLQETFWAFRFGVLVDQFSIPWIINCEKPARQLREVVEGKE